MYCDWDRASKLEETIKMSIFVATNDEHDSVSDWVESSSSSVFSSTL